MTNDNLPSKSDLIEALDCVADGIRAVDTEDICWVIGALIRMEQLYREADGQGDVISPIQVIEIEANGGAK